MQTEVEGIVLKVTLYSETSKILHLLTKEYGLISVIAKGASSVKSKLRSVSIPFLYGKFNIIYKKDKMSVLCDGSIIKLFGESQNNLELYAYITYLCELSYDVLRENNNKNIFYILIASLNKIDQGFDYMTMKNIVEFKYLSFLGIEPDLSSCSKCYQDKQIYALDGRNGGYICQDCYSNERRVKENFLKVIKRYQDVNIDEIKEIKIDKEDAMKINLFLKEYYETFSGIYIKSLKFLETFIKL